MTITTTEYYYNMSPIPSLTPSNITKLKTYLNQSNQLQPQTPQWHSIQHQLSDLINEMICHPAPNKSECLQYYNSGIFEEIIIPIINQSQSHPFHQPHSQITLENCWCIISRAMSSQDKNEFDNVHTLTRGVQLGFIDSTVRELKRRPIRGEILIEAFTCLCSTAVYSEFTKIIIDSQAPLACLELIRDGGNIIHDDVIRSNIVDSFRILNSIAGYCSEPIRALPGLVDIVSNYLPLLTPEGNHQLIMVGFRAVKLLIRVSSNTDKRQIIEENSMILQFYPKFIRKLMDVGREKHSYLLYNTIWRIAGVSLDMSLIATSIGDKSLLVPLVPLMVELLAFHHHNNSDEYDLIRFGMIFLFQASLDTACLIEMKKNKHHMKIIQHVILSDRLYDRDTVSLLDDVMNKLNE
jgi:hypothetical protein